MARQKIPSSLVRACCHELLSPQVYFSFLVCDLLKALGLFALNYCHEDQVSDVASCASVASHLDRLQGTSSGCGACTGSFGYRI